MSFPYPKPHSKHLDEILTIPKEKDLDYNQLLREITDIETKLKQLKERFATLQSKEKDPIGI